MSDTRLELLQARSLNCLVRPSGSADAGAPLLCFLHGYDEAAPLEIFEALQRHGPLHPGTPRDCIDRFVIVAPQLPVSGDLWRRYGPDIRNIVLDEAERRECDLRRLYLTGFSFGGNGAFDLAIAQRELWAAVWPVDPTRVPRQAIDCPIWLSLGEIARASADVLTATLGLEPLPASGDTAGDRVWTDEGLDHTRTATLAYSDVRPYEWLLSKRRSRGR